MGAQQPYLYSAVQRNDARFPDTPFDPKAVTRASLEPKPRKPKPDGPLLSFNRHPDAHEVLPYRSNNLASMSNRTKKAIKWLRYLQQGLRLLELVSAAGILALMILITKVDDITGWVMRITPGVVILHCIYAVYHLSRDAAGRPPASSAAYHLFSGVSDLAVLPLYAFGALNVHTKGNSWQTLLADQDLMKYFVPVLYYTLIAAASLHLISLSFSGWLGWTFRRISHMPPDMNPLEDNLTARPQHKKNKSSVATFSTVESDRRRSDVPLEEVPLPPSIPFMHTRNQSSTSIGSRDSRNDLPSRQYQIVPGNSPRHSQQSSITSVKTKRTSVARSLHRGSYTAAPMNDPDPRQPITDASRRDSQPRAPKFTETWMPTDSLISRTNQRNREIAAAKTIADSRSGKSYEVLSQRYDLDASDSEFDDENNPHGGYGDADLSSGLHPDPLRLNPTKTRATPPRQKTPFYAEENALGEVSSNARRVSASRDITDEKPALTSHGSPWKRNRDSSIQLESDFYSRPYGELKSATPPVMVGSNRKISSGNDYDSKYSSGAYGRRNVSGKIAEEGLAGDAGRRYSRYRSMDG